MPPLHGAGIRFVSTVPAGADGEIGDKREFLGLLLDGKPRARLFIEFKDDEGGLLPFIRIDLAQDGASLTRADIASAKLYSRIADPVEPHTLPDAEQLRALGEAIAGQPHDASVTIPIPAVYTYFGQFLAHEVSRMLGEDADGKPLNQVSPRLDLESLFACPPAGLQEAPDLYSGAGVKLGLTHAIPGSGYADHPTVNDLARAHDGEPFTFDPRSDGNLIVAQLQVQLTKFHLVVAAVCGESDPEAQRTITRRHIQSIVIDDYLPRLIEKTLYDDIMAEGRGIVWPGGAGDFLLPIEFAAACFRFGHSMVRAQYVLREDTIATLGSFLQNTKVGGAVNTLTSYRLSQKWTIDWPQFLSSSLGDQFGLTKPIDTELSGLLGHLDARLFEEQDFDGGSDRINLATRTLLRGRALALPCGQDLAQIVRDRLPPQRVLPAILDAASIAAVSDAALADALQQAGPEGTLAERTPLWFYVLREARIERGGAGLGALAGRIVMETLHAAVAATPGGILGADGTKQFQAHPALEPECKERYTLDDLMRAVQTHWEDVAGAGSETG